MNRPRISPITPKQRYLRTMNAIGWVALLLLALTPLIFDLKAQDDAFFTPKWAWLALWTAVGWGAMVARAFAGRPLMFYFNEVWIGALLFALWHWVAVLWARSGSLAVERAGQITWLTLALGLGLQLIPHRRALLRLAWAAVVVGMVTALWVLAEDVVQAWFRQYAWIHPNLSDWRGYLAAGLGNTSHIGDLLALTFIPVLTLWGEARSRTAKFILALAAGLIPAGLIVTYSVGSTVGLLAGVLVMLILVLRRDRGRWFLRRAVRWVVMLLAWTLVILFFVTDHPANPHQPGILKQGFASGRWQDGWPTRLAIWAQSLEMIRQHPLLGVGSGNFTYIFPETDSKLVWNRPDLRVYQGSYTNAAHNELIQAWAELGIIGLFLLLALVSLAFYSLFKDITYASQPAFLTRLTLAGLLTAWVIQAQMNFSLQHPAGALTFYAILLAIAVEKRTRANNALMPPLVLQTGIVALRIDWRTMSQPTGVGLAFCLPDRLAMLLGVVLLGAIAAWSPRFWRPVLAQREYRRAQIATQAGMAIEADQHFNRALALDRNATGCRSRYSAWLLEQGRSQECLAQMVLVRRRLNSNELWQREALALVATGNRSAAEQAIQTLRQRVWSSQFAPTVPPR